jgi:hypothetical protein
VFQAAWFGWVAISGQTLFPASSIESIEGWDVRFDRAAEDQQLWLRLSQHGPVALIPDLVIENRAHPDQSRPEGLQEIETSMRLEVGAHLKGTKSTLAADSVALRTQIRAAEAAYHRGDAAVAARIALRAVAHHPHVAVDPLIRSRVRVVMTHSLAGVIVGKYLPRLRWVSHTTRAIFGRSIDPCHSSH